MGKQSIDNDSKQIGRVPTGTAVIGNAYGLPCKSVIHAVGPVDKNSKLERDAIRAILEIMEDYGIMTLALPAIATGIFGFPLKEFC
jgi:O-acetyl-ADP-ribose deacetylase (regulator of RNase III)